MDTILLEVNERKPEEKAKALRSRGRIPAEYYGLGKKNKSFDMDYQGFRKVFEKAGENTIIELSAGGKTFPVLVHAIQYNPVSDSITHVDFVHVDMQKEVVTSVKIVVTGTAPAVKNLGGVLDILKHEVKIKCLPKDLIHEILVDVTPIVDFHTSIRVKDLKVPSTIKLIDSPEDTVVTATPPRAEEVAAPVAAVVPAEGATATGAPGAPAAPAAASPAAAAPAKDAKK